MRLERRPQQSSRRLLYLVVGVQLVLFGSLVDYLRHIVPGVLDVRTLIASDTSASLQEKVNLVHPRPKNYDPPNLVWLMSFPNSGTSYTLRLVGRLSQTHVATNYGHENKKDTRASFPVYADQMEGPYWMELGSFPNYTFPKDNVLVKTHCGGRCQTCPPSRYAETTYSFRHACQRGQRRTVEGGESRHTQVHYPTNRIAKAIHLIRDPFDNVVSRFHLERRGNRSEGSFNNTREGFREYCLGLNARFFQEESKSILFDNEWLHRTATVPCRADFFRWIEWHNQAFHLTTDLGVDTVVLEYGSYTSNFNSTCNTLLDFLKLERHEEAEPFIEGKIYRDHFTKDERHRLSEVVQKMASRATWEHVAKYFVD